MASHKVIICKLRFIIYCTAHCISCNNIPYIRFVQLLAVVNITVLRGISCNYTLMRLCITSIACIIICLIFCTAIIFTIVKTIYQIICSSINTYNTTCIIVCKLYIIIILVINHSIDRYNIINQLCPYIIIQQLWLVIKQHCR